MPLSPSPRYEEAVLLEPLVLGGLLVDVRLPLQEEVSNVSSTYSGQRLTLWTCSSTLSSTISAPASARVLKGTLGSFATFSWASLEAVELVPFYEFRNIVGGVPIGSVSEDLSIIKSKRPATKVR
jgi:fluoride ion exporter CrcB/FEX